MKSIVVVQADPTVPTTRAGHRVLQHLSRKRVSRNELGEIAAQYKNWVMNRSQRWGVPVLEAPQGRRDDFIGLYLKKAKPD